MKTRELLEALGEPFAVNVGGLAPGGTPYIELKYVLGDNNEALEEMLGIVLAQAKQASKDGKITVRFE